MKKIYFILIAYLTITIIFLILSFANKSYALPSDPDVKKDAGHRGITKISTDIKKNLPESQTNGLMKQLENYGNTIHISNVSEDFLPLTTMHFYDPATSKGYLGLFPTAKDRASDFYKTALKANQKGDDSIYWQNLAEIDRFLTCREQQG